MTAEPVYLEVGKKKIFACAVNWPGWSRSGKTEEDAIEALASYADRYAPVAKAAHVRWHSGDDFQVIERVPGNATTDFGAPGVVADIDREAADAKRLGRLVAASWTIFDEIVAETPPTLRKGPRGGGRDRDKMVDHVLAAEASYIRKIGVKHKAPQVGDTAAIEAMRRDTLAAITAGGADASGDGAATGWPIPYLARRLAWHVLDHAWEMQDKSS